MKRTIRIATAAVAAAVALAVPAGAAGASVTRVPRRTMAAVRHECNRKIDNRVATLANLEARISATRRLSEAQKAPMIAGINETIAVLNGMYRPAVNTATTRAALAQACSSIFVDLRIFAVYAPQVRYSAMVDALGNFSDSLSAQVAAAHDGGADTTEEEALLASAGARLQDATAKIASVSPESFNADPAGTRATWDAVHADVAGAFVDLLTLHRMLHPAA